MSERITCIIVDDEPFARSILRNYCSHLPFLHIIGEFGNALDARNFLSEQKTDLVFLDINMPVLNGIGFINSLKNVPIIIFTTAYQEYAVNAFELSVIDYLLKPFSLERFIIAIDKVKEKLNLSNVQKESDREEKISFYIRSEGKIYLVSYADCLYAEAKGNYTRLVAAAASYVTKIPFSAFIQDFPADIFLRVHRSFVINKTRISYISGGLVFIGKHEIPIAGSYRRSLFKAIGLE